MRGRYLINSVLGTVMSVTTIFTGFVINKILVDSLGITAVGFQNFLMNTVAILSISELGIANAINFQMYSVLARNDREAAASLLALYRRIYFRIGIVVLSLATVLAFFIPKLSGADVLFGFKTITCFLIVAAGSVISYTTSYKRAMLIAGEYNFIINSVRCVILLIVTALQIVSIWTFKNLYIFFLIQTIFILLENLILNYWMARIFPWVNKLMRIAHPVTKETVEKLVVQVKGLVLHKLATFIVLGSDTLIITYFLGLGVAGLYANYFLIVKGLLSISQAGFNAVVPTLGVAMVTDKGKGSMSPIFNRLFFVNVFIISVVCSGVYVLISPLITIWLGPDVVLPASFGALFAAMAAVQGMRATFAAFKEALGIFYEDRFVPVIESLVNVVFGIVLVQVLGLPGIIIAFLLSSTVLYGWSYFKYVWVYVKDSRLLLYVLYLVGSAVLICSSVMISDFIYGLITGHFISVINFVIGIFIILVVSVFIYGVIYLIVRRFLAVQP